MNILLRIFVVLRRKWHSSISRNPVNERDVRIMKPGVRTRTGSIMGRLNPNLQGKGNGAAGFKRDADMSLTDLQKQIFQLG